MGYPSGEKERDGHGAAGVVPFFDGSFRGFGRSMFESFFSSVRWWTPVAAWLWASGACWFAVSPPVWLRFLSATALLVAAVSWWNATPEQPWRRWAIPFGAVLWVAVIHFSQRPPAEAAWALEHRQPPRSVRRQTDESPLTYQIEGVRTRTNGTIHYVNKEVRLDQVERVWLGVQHFTVVTPIAHTFLSFELANGERIAVSVEARRYANQRYSPLRGLFRGYGLVAVIGSEEEVTGRALGPVTSGADFPLYLYETVATPDQAQAMFTAVMDRINAMEERPEFYNTLTNNCTTNIVDRCNEVAPIYLSPFNPRIMFPGYTGAAAYRHGLLDNHKTYRELKREAATRRR